MLSIKNNNIVSINYKKWGTEITINRSSAPSKSNNKKNNQLSDALHFLPSGFVFKEETGMGATTLEIFAERNSIIVEPIKITASSKAHKHGCLYVGSETRFHNIKSPTKEEISYYAQDPQYKYKKIIVVADSLPKVLEALLDIDDNIIKDYFLVIDEIDSFQLDSSYRKSMENCIDFYKLFPKSMRAMLSATKIEFSDPKLKKEPITYIKYDTPSVRKIDVITTNTNDLEGMIIDTILNCLNNNPNEKLFIAYNTVNGCFNLAEHLVLKQNFKKEDVKILCSSASKNKVNGYYYELDSDKLPAKVNFFTSAYFTGFDINEKYHLVSVSGNRNKVQSLSDRRFKQIAGRCRKGLLSETIIHDIIPKENIETFTSKDYLDAAKEQIASLNCMQKHYENNRILEVFIGDVNNGFIKLLEEKDISLVRKNVYDVYDISYLNIDSKLEGIRVKKELYLKHDSLYIKLTQNGNVVNHVLAISSTKVDNTNISVLDRDKQITEIIEKLKKVKYQPEIDDIIKEDELTYIQKSICEGYKKLIDFLEPTTTLDIIKSSLIGKRDSRKYNRIFISAFIQTLPDDHFFISRLQHYFTKNKKYNIKDVFERLDLLLGEINLFTSINTQSKKIKLFNTLCKTYRKRDNKGTDYYKITGYNPFNFNVIDKRKSMGNNDLLTTLKSYF